MSVSYDIAGTLRAQDHGHPPLIFDARGNGGGGICPTITGDHQNRITDYTAVVVSRILDSDGGETEKSQKPYEHQGGGDSTKANLVVETLVFDEAQITSRQNGNRPTWGGAATLSTETPTELW